MTTASIVTHRTDPSELKRVVECIARCPEVTKIFIVDNSPDDSLRVTALSLPHSEYIHVENNGFGAGHNVALREVLASRAEFHLVINADVMWEGDVLSPIIDHLRKKPDIGLLSPKIYYPDGTLQYACRMLPTPWDVFAKRFLPASLIRKRMARYLLADADHDREFNCPYLLGSFMMFRTDALRETGIFDERFFMYPEDIDISRRIHENRPTMFWPKVTVIHAHAAASRKSLRMLCIHIVNMIRYFNKWGWWRDPLRRRFNRRLLKNMPRIFGPPPQGRG